MRRNHLIGLAVSATTVAVCGAAASSVSAAPPAPLTVTSCGVMDFDQSGTTLPDPLTVDPFDPSLGTLLSVHIEGQSELATFGIENLQPVPMRTEIVVDSYVSNWVVTSTWGEVLGTADGTYSFINADHQLAAFDGNSDFMGPSGFLLTWPSSFSYDYTPANAPAGFTGTDPFEVLDLAGLNNGVVDAAITSSNTLPGENEESWGALDFTASACVTYTYAPLVAPTTTAPPTTTAAPATTVVVPPTTSPTTPTTPTTPVVTNPVTPARPGAVSPSRGGRLPATGNEWMPRALFGAASVAAGAALLAMSRRRRDGVQPG